MKSKFFVGFFIPLGGAFLGREIFYLTGFLSIGSGLLAFMVWVFSILSVEAIIMTKNKEEDIPCIIGLFIGIILSVYLIFR